MSLCDADADAVQVWKRAKQARCRRPGFFGDLYLRHTHGSSSPAMEAHAFRMMMEVWRDCQDLGEGVERVAPKKGESSRHLPAEPAPDFALSTTEIIS